MSDRKTYFCEEPWTGGFSIQTNLDVHFCSCYLNMKIGSLRDSSIDEIWNSKQMRQIRESFSKGDLPRVCRGQLCPVALGHGDGEPVPLTSSRRRISLPTLDGVIDRIGGLLR